MSTPITDEIRGYLQSIELSCMDLDRQGDERRRARDLVPDFQRVLKAMDDNSHDQFKVKELIGELAKLVERLE